jgi:hypothetical protein
MGSRRIRLSVRRSLIPQCATMVILGGEGPDPAVSGCANQIHRCALMVILGGEGGLTPLGL